MPLPFVSRHLTIIAKGVTILRVTLAHVPFGTVVVDRLGTQVLLLVAGPLYGALKVGLFCQYMLPFIHAACLRKCHRRPGTVGLPPRIV